MVWVLRNMLPGLHFVFMYFSSTVTILLGWDTSL